MAEKTKSPLKKKKSGLGLFNTGAVDLYFLILVLILLAVGLVMLFPQVILMLTIIMTETVFIILESS